MSRKNMVEYKIKPKITVTRNANMNFTPKTKGTAYVATDEVSTEVSSQDVDKNNSFLKKLNEILTHTLISDDLKLLTNLIDDSGKIILSGYDLCELISLMLNVPINDISINYKENFVTECLKVKILPYKHISNIKIKNKDFKNSQNEAYNILTDVYQISLRTVYIS